jgi:hypothetical protein
MFIDDSMLAQCSQFIIPGQYLKYIKGKKHSGYISRNAGSSKFLLNFKQIALTLTVGHDHSRSETACFNKALETVFHYRVCALRS